MKTENLNPMQSLEVIMEAIGDARAKFEEDGFIYIFWGLLIGLASLAQFILLRTGYYEINYFPYFLTILGGAYTFYHYRRKESAGQKNHLSKVIMSLWIMLFLNMTILGFAFAPVFGKNLLPIMLILSGIGMGLSGVIIKKSLLLYAGIFLNLAGIASIMLPWNYQPLALSIGSLVGVFLPGLLIKLRKRDV